MVLGGKKPEELIIYFTSNVLFLGYPSSETFNLPLTTHSLGYCHRFRSMDCLQLTRPQSVESEFRGSMGGRCLAYIR